MFHSYVDRWWKRTVEPAFDGMMNRMGEAGVAEAQRLAPVDTGQLRASIGYVYRQSDRTLRIYADAPYAMYQEFGSDRCPAHPFLRPALLKLKGFRLSAANVEVGFQSRSGAAPNLDSTPRNTHTNRKLDRGLVRRARVRVRQYDPHRIG